jgi:prophage regulatory protein
MDARMEHSAENKVSSQPKQAPLPGSDDYDNLPQFAAKFPLPFRRTIRRHELHQIVPLAQTTVYEMERRGEFPRRFHLTARCVVWDLEEVQAWIDTRRQASRSQQEGKTVGPDVAQRKHRPLRRSAGST